MRIFSLIAASAARRYFSAPALLFIAAAPFLPQAAQAEADTAGRSAAHIGAGVGSSVPVKISPDTDAQRKLIERGRYLAVASDCTACHTERGGRGDFAGGYVFKLPMGRIVASNITPSKQYGIGSWSEAEFARAVRAGVRPGGRHLYPAMPYTEYSYMTDGDMQALYAYFMQGIPAVDSAPAEQTKMHFPFNVPGAMIFWNALFLNHERYAPDADVSPLINRGRYLVDGPAHCGTCHTPRNFMMASDNSRYMGGAELAGWWAPNITSDPISGIGGWSEAELITYLQNGHIRDKSQANGPMAEAVEYSFRYMARDDLRAITAYLKTIPPLPTAGQLEPAYTRHRPVESSFAQYEMATAGSSAAASSAVNTLDGATLYNTACAACHGANGEGADDGSSPSLLANRAVGSVNPNAMILTVAYGLNRAGADKAVSMPGFLDSTNPIFAAMNEEQIAAVVNYVRGNFGHRAEKINADDVKTTLAGDKLPFLIKHAALLAILGILAGLAVLSFLLWHFLLRGRRVKTEAAEFLHKAEKTAAAGMRKAEKKVNSAVKKAKAEGKAAAKKALKTVKTAEQKIAAEPKAAAKKAKAALAGKKPSRKNKK